MGAMSDFLEKKLLNHVLRNVAYTAPATVYLALFTVALSDTSGLTSEVSGGGYARQSAAFDNPDAHPAGTTKNTAQVSFPVATASWGTIQAVAVIDALTNGNILFYANLSTAKTVDNGDQLRFDAATLTVTLD